MNVGKMRIVGEFNAMVALPLFWGILQHISDGKYVNSTTIIITKLMLVTKVPFTDSKFKKTKQV